MNRADTVRGVLLWEGVADAAKAKAAAFREQLNADARNEYDEQGTAPTWRLKDIGTVTLPLSTETPYVADLDALTKWAAERYPDQIETITQLRAAFVAALLARVEVDEGQVIDTTTGEIVPGVGVREGGLPKALSIRPAAAAKTVIRVAADEVVGRLEAEFGVGQPVEQPAVAS